MRKRIIYIVAVMFLTGCQTAEAPQQDITPQTQTVHCTFVGDLLYEQPYYDWIEKDSQDKGYYDLVKPFFQKDDLSIANLETPIGGTELKISGVGYSFNASREIGEQVASLGLEVVSTANNHANDRGNKGIDNTLKFLKELMKTKMIVIRDVIKRLMAFVLVMFLIHMQQIRLYKIRIVQKLDYSIDQAIENSHLNIKQFSKKK